MDELFMTLFFSRNSQRTSRDRKPVVLAAASSSRARDEPDLSSQGSSLDLQSLMDRLSNDVGSIALFSGRELELLAELDADDFIASNPSYDLEFVKQIQEAADRHLTEKREIRDALGLLKLYQKSSKNSSSPKRKRGGASSSGKKWDLLNHCDFSQYLLHVSDHQFLPTLEVTYFTIIKTKKRASSTS